MNIHLGALPLLRSRFLAQLFGNFAESCRVVMQGDGGWGYRVVDDWYVVILGGNLVMNIDYMMQFNAWLIEFSTYHSLLNDTFVLDDVHN